MAKVTPLAEIHAELDAKFIPYNGWKMPQNYPGGILTDLKHAEQHCSVIDFSCSGKIRIAGNGCAEALDTIFMYQVSALECGQTGQNCLLADNGCFIDFVTVFRMDTEDFFVITSGNCLQNVLERLKGLLPDTIQLQDLTEVIAEIDLPGEEAEDVLIEAEADPEKLPASGRCGIVEIAGIRCIISAANQLSNSGFELFCGADNAIDLWDELTCIEPVRPVGLAARDALRIAMKSCAFGTEFTAALTPVDCGLEIPARKFAGSEALLGKTAEYTLVFAEFDSKQPPFAGDKIKLSSGEEIGTVCSAAAFATRGKSGAICRIKKLSDGVSGKQVIAFREQKEQCGEVISECFC